MTLRQCMGGFCKQREACAHYVAPVTLGVLPAERLCGDREEPEPIRLSPAMRQRFGSLLAGATPEQQARFEREMGKP